MVQIVRIVKGNASTQRKRSGAAPLNAAIRWTVQDLEAVAEIQRAGFAQNRSDAVRFALQRTIRWVRQQEAA